MNLHILEKVLVLLLNDIIQPAKPYSMERPLTITTADIQILQSGIQRIQTDLESNHQKRIHFSQDPIGFLNNYDVSLISSFTQNEDLSQNFIKNSEEIRLRIRRLFNQCTACRLSVLLAVYSVLGSCQLPIGLFMDALPTLIGVCRDILHKQDIEFERYLANLQGSIEEMRPSAFANKLCEDLGFCNPLSQTTPPSEIKPVDITTDTQKLNQPH